MARSTPSTGARWLSGQRESLSSPESNQSRRLSGGFTQGTLPRPKLPGFFDTYAVATAQDTSIANEASSETA